ncbi:glycosyltransferase family 25 protein [Photobacterium minamisatsumaniensis]|uniref:glycosyltransferase family 25 protein n=1 Tax=Photobacterium minamisatsumaniensis TaxID=2910233 RepID=UPI003D147933
MIDTYVINLSSSSSRRENIAKQLGDIKANYTFFDAVNGHISNHPLFSKYDDDLSHQYRGKSLSKGQLGCYASHYLLWEKCIELNKPIVIIEDDCLLDKIQFSTFISNAGSLGDQFECIRLFDNKRKNYCSQKIMSLNNIDIHKFNKGHMSATGYYLTPKGAQKLVNHSQRWYMAVDIYMDRFWINEVECFGTVPACLTNDPKFDSDIGYEKQRSTRKMQTRLKREWFNFTELVRREIHNFTFSIKSKK